MRQLGCASLSDWPAGPSRTPIVPKLSSMPPAVLSSTSGQCQMSTGFATWSALANRSR